MKKVIIGLIFLILVSSVYAEPAKGESWGQYIVRVNTMSDRLDNVYFDGDNWQDKYAAAYATHGWLQISYSHILYYADKGTISLTQQERRKYTLLKEYHTIQADEFGYNIRHASGSTGAWILRRYDYWMKLLDDGGTITFN
jgi:hypothetical protein